MDSNNKNNKYSSFAVMMLVASVGALGISCAGSSVAVRVGLFAAAAAFLILSRISRDAWSASFIYKCWMVLALTSFGLLNVYEVVTDQMGGGGLKSAKLALLAIFMIGIQMIWRGFLLTKLNERKFNGE